MDKLNNFVWSEHCSTEDFERGWTEVITEFGLSENEWLKEMFNLRANWIPAYFNDDPMVGLLRTTSRSESSNFFFNHFVQRGDTLSEFYLCYDSAIDKQRNNSALLNHSDDIIPRTLSTKRIEKDAADLYTRAIFYKVQEEILVSGGDVFVQESMELIDGVKILKVRDTRNKNRIFEVLTFSIYINTLVSWTILCMYITKFF